MDLFAEDDQHCEDTEKREGCPDCFERLFFDASAVDAKDTEAATRGRPSVGAVGMTVDHVRALFDLLENALVAYEVQGTKSRSNFDPNAPRDSDGHIFRNKPSDTIAGPDPDIGQAIFHLAKLMISNFNRQIINPLNLIINYRYVFNFGIIQCIKIFRIRF